LDTAGSNNLESIFWFSAIAGTTFFVIRMMMMIFMGFGHSDIDGEIGHDVADVDHGMDHGDSEISEGHDAGFDHADSPDVAFKLLSINTLTAFTMMFGWIGLSSKKQFLLGNGIALLLATAVGVVSMVIIGYMFKYSMKLTSRGERFLLEETYGDIAKVYLKIPKGGTGKIQITVNGMLREIDAVSENGEEIASFTEVKIVEVVDSNTVAVKKHL